MVKVEAQVDRPRPILLIGELDVCVQDSVRAELQSRVKNMLCI